MARMAAMAATGSGVVARMLAAMAAEAPPGAADAAAGAAVAAAGAEAVAAGAAGPADIAAVAVGGPDAGAADAAAPEVGGPESAADAHGVPDLQQLLEKIDAGLGGPGPQVSPDAAAAQAALDQEQALIEITKREQARLRRKHEAEDAAAAASKAADAAEAASEAEANRLWSIEVAAARAAVPHGTAFTHSEWPNLAAAKAAFNKRRRSGTPVDRPGADAPRAAGSAVADAASANPGSGSLDGTQPPPCRMSARPPSGWAAPRQRRMKRQLRRRHMRWRRRCRPLRSPRRRRPLPSPRRRPPCPRAAPTTRRSRFRSRRRSSRQQWRPIRTMTLGTPQARRLFPPEFEAELDAQMAQERAARLAAAWQDRPKSPPVLPKPKRDPHIPIAEVVEAFIAGQRSMGKGKGLASPFPQAWGAKGKGKAKSADPFVGLDGRGHFRGREASRDRDGFKRGRHGFYEREGPSTCAGRPLATQRSTATAPARSASARLRTA